MNLGFLNSLSRWLSLRTLNSFTSLHLDFVWFAPSLKDFSASRHSISHQALHEPDDFGFGATPSVCLSINIGVDAWISQLLRSVGKPSFHSLNVFREGFLRCVDTRCLRMLLGFRLGLFPVRSPVMFALSGFVCGCPGSGAGFGSSLAVGVVSRV